MTSISRQQFNDAFKNGIATNGDPELKKLDANNDGKIEGKELDALWNTLDAKDHDGSANTISDPTVLNQIAALQKSGSVANAPVITAPQGETLKRGAKGEKVTAAQEQLQKLGFDLGPKGADGDFGAATQTAIKAFQKDNGLKETGELDPLTAETLAKSKPVYPEYDQMFKDGVLQTTLGIGFDEDGNDIALRKGIVDGLTERGFKLLDVKSLSDDELTKLGFDPKTIDRNATYYTKTFQHGGKDVKALVKLVDRNSPGAKDQFATGMKKDDLILYTGHGRMGSGPDFDHANSAAGNYVIGTPAEQGHYTLGKNDVDKDGALSDGYQLMLFDACNSKWYLDDLRSKPKNKSEANLDVMASNRELPWSTSKNDIFVMLDGVMAGKSMPEIKGGLDSNNAESGKGPAFRADGFRGNKYRPEVK